ncbi:MAG: hypothetical protein R3195_12585 [Gemmatimonadota bacterium]|nr:hypothetical protein [Gemmatimonadota bacterium]
MDWDGVGTFAMFFASGAVGVGVIMLRAYKARLEASLEKTRIEAESRRPELDDGRLDELENQVRRLTERLEFNEKLLERGSAPTD